MATCCVTSQTVPTLFAPAAGSVVGTVAGCNAVFQVAVVAAAVAATVGTAVAKGVGPGTKRNISMRRMQHETQLTSICRE
jgi:hypothetical protein